MIKFKSSFLISILIFLLSACHTSSKTSSQPKALEEDHSSRLAVDWAGTYQGILPCQDCEGIQTTLKLDRDMSYFYRRVYLGKNEKPAEISGTFSWDPTGNIISLNDSKALAPTQFKVGENMIMKLDVKGQPMTGVQAEKNTLRKEISAIREKQWKLIELDGKVIKTAIKEPYPHLFLKAQGSQVNGHGGCNSFFGQYELPGNNKLRFVNLAATEMACAQMGTETQFLSALRNTDSYIILHDTLMLNKARMATLAKLVAVYQ
ncbi:MAG: copper resistance protein NlpE N-terminal domain-containing protein [Chitinophagaceae bacterium]|nr:copper resistance protein NlpE N-terminal domain-containing protein [Chitinophagaceae bacterium]